MGQSASTNWRAPRSATSQGEGGDMDDHDNGLDRTRWILEALIAAGAIILLAYGAFVALVPLT